MAKKKKSNIEARRQGDVLSIKIDKLPENVKQTKKCTLAFGEKTGHHHTIESGAVGYADPNDAEGLAEFMTVTEDGAALGHQEHDTINFPAGTYQNVIQTRYTPEALQRVRD